MKERTAKVRRVQDRTFFPKFDTDDQIFEEINRTNLKTQTGPINRNTHICTKLNVDSKTKCAYKTARLCMCAHWASTTHMTAHVHFTT